jgi:nicotinate-nucleotide adenylyltransferase
MAQQIGIFGGTFDPIHHGHLILARAAIEAFQLDSIIFVPAALNPHKDDPGTAPGFLRLEMIRAAIEGEKHFRVSDQELRRDPPSYTIDTVEQIAAQNPQAALYLIIGADNARKLPTWHRYDELAKLVRFIVLDRPGCADLLPGALSLARLLDISATDIRNRLAKNLSIRYLVPESVRAIIETHKLYTR